MTLTFSLHRRLAWRNSYDAAAAGRSSDRHTPIPVFPAAAPSSPWIGVIGDRGS